jgi:hypothetical protein
MANNISNLAENEIGQLEEASLDDLYRTVGQRIADAERAQTLEQLKELGSFSPTLHTDPSTLALSEDLLILGRKLVRRINKAAYGYFCTEANVQERDDFFSKINLGEAGVVAFLTGILVTSLAVAPAIAGVVALAIHRIVIVPGVEVACESWAEIVEAEDVQN